MEKFNQKKHFNGIIIAFGELFLKSEGVRKIFERKLINNISFFLNKNSIDFKIYSFRERIFVNTEKTSKALKLIKNIFGVSWFGKCFYFPEIKFSDFNEFIAQNYYNWIKKNETFAIKLKTDKSVLKKGREDIIKEIAQKINRKVDLSRPKKEIMIEIRKKGYFLYFKKRKGQAGLPLGVSGKVLSLVSGGIDSPVASYLIAKRGAENIWLHFHSFPLVSSKSIQKVKDLVKVFLNFQPKLKVYFVPFLEIQKEIKIKTDSKYRILLYRRAMFKIAEKIAKKEKCGALVTGESLGQVSSQTMVNISLIDEPVKIPVFRPLIGMDKEEIVKIAKKIKSYQISIAPQEDCCSLFVPKKQTGEGKIKILKEMEKRVGINNLIKKTISRTESELY